AIAGSSNQVPIPKPTASPAGSPKSAFVSVRQGTPKAIRSQRNTAGGSVGSDDFGAPPRYGLAALLLWRGFVIDGGDLSGGAVRWQRDTAAARQPQAYAQAVPAAGGREHAVRSHSRSLRR